MWPSALTVNRQTNGLTPGVVFSQFRYDIIQVKQAYKKLALRWHPDVLPAHEREKAEAVFKDIVAAYNRISKGGLARPAGSRYASAQYQGARGVASSEATPNFSNAMVAFCLIVPLMLTGVHFGKSFSKWEEQSWRQHGIMSPPVNPWLKEELRAKEFSHRAKWSQRSLDAKTVSES